MLPECFIGDLDVFLSGVLCFCKLLFPELCFSKTVLGLAASVDDVDVLDGVGDGHVDHDAPFVVNVGDAVAAPLLSSLLLLSVSLIGVFFEDDHLDSSVFPDSNFLEDGIVDILSNPFLSFSEDDDNDIAKCSVLLVAEDTVSISNPYYPL